MKRPILVAIIGYLIGIIWGLYLKISIVFLYAFFIPIIVFIKFFKHNKERKKFRIYSLSRYFRYIKLILNSKVVVILVLFSVISNTIVILKNTKFNNLYKDIENVEIIGIVKELKSQGIYKDVYKIKVLSLNNSKDYYNTHLYINVNKKNDIQYGTKVIIKGKYKEPQSARNYGGLDYKQYLKMFDIYGTINVNSLEKIYNTKWNFGKVINDIRQSIKNNARNLLDEKTYSIYMGIILGDTSEIDENTKEIFRNSNMAHILAVSGMHISYIIVGITVILNKILGRKMSNMVAILVLLLYCIITGFSPSIIRASTMGIMVLLSKLIHRKNDIWLSIAISLFIILIYNPYLIMDVGLQFSYAGTLGIMLFNKNVLKILNKSKENKSIIKQIISISISAQVFILPLSIFHFNTIGIYFIIVNILLSIIIGPIIVLSFIFLLFLMLNLGFAKFTAIVLNPLLKGLIFLSYLGQLPLSKIYIKTPNIWKIVIFYIVVLLCNFIYYSKHKKNPNLSNLRVRYILEDIKYRARKIGFKTISIISILVVIVNFIICFACIELNKSLNIHFVDVGQGDCCFIETPNKQTIIIDGGGSEATNYDVGKRVLIPYILDMGYTRIDYIIISHFDTDHVRTAF